MPETLPSARLSVVILRDGSWPDQEGVCCWRSAVEAAFTEAGAASVTGVTVRTRPKRVNRPGAPGRLAWLPPAIRRPLVVAYRRLLRGWGARQGRATPPPAQALRQAAGAALVVAESPAAAAVALAQGVPRHRVWVLVLPPDWLADDVPGQASELTELAERVGGMLTDSEPAREAVERATSTLRPRVELFPPVAIDRPCPHRVAAKRRTGVPPEVAQLALWQRLAAQADGPASPPVRYSFAAARFLGYGLADARSGWDGQPIEPSTGKPSGWTADAQRDAARRVLATVTPVPGTQPRRTALVAGFDLKFAVELAERLAARGDLDVAVDEWPTLDNGTPQTAGLLTGAESILAEWVRPSAVQIARRKRPGQFLAVRLHRYELDAPYARELAIDKVDAVVYIAPLFGRRIRDELGWPVEKLVYIPNYIDLGALDRPKLPEARFGLGFVGIEYKRKRFDLALDLLAALRREDRRYTLVVRSVMPWQNSFAWAREPERAYTAWCLTRIERDPLLRDAVIFDPPGRDMARWFRRVGHVLSTSDSEGCHTAVAEGMASGAVPVVRPWAGADEIYDKEWIHASTGAAAAEILANAEESRWVERAVHAKAEINLSYNPAAVVRAWADLLHGDLAAARRPFARYAPGSLRVDGEPGPG